MFLTVNASGSTDPCLIIFDGRRCPVQPLDLSVFGPMKQCWRRKVVYVRRTWSKPTRREFMNLFTLVFQESLSPENVNSGFKKQPYFLSTVKSFINNLEKFQRLQGPINSKASWRKRLGARLPPLGSRVRWGPCGFRGGRNGVWVGFFAGFIPFSPTTNFIPPFLHTHLIHFVPFHQPL